MPEDLGNPDWYAENTVEIGGEVMTPAQYDAARFPLVAELDQLRAVVDAARAVTAGPESTGKTVQVPVKRLSDLAAALRRLEPTGESHVAELDRLRTIVDGYLSALLPGTAPAVRQAALDALAAAAHCVTPEELDASPTGGGRVSDDDPTIVILAEHYGCVADLLAERDRLRAAVEAVSVMWDNVVHANPEGTLMGFPLADYANIEDALAALDENPTGEDA
jgi:hypothetical protein